MSNKIPRRNLLSRLTLGISSLFLLPFTSFSNTSKKEEEMEKEHPVNKIKALGFQWETADPFLFCVHHEDKYPKGNDEMGPDASLDGRHIGQDFVIKDGWRMYHGAKVPGFPGHPHRGFETITVVREGMVDHSDSLGASGRYGNGDVQWMTAGKGVQHCEMFPLLHQDKENPLELFQIWLNLPKKNKMVEPHFKMLWRDSIPKQIITSDGGKTEIEVIVGDLGTDLAPSPAPDSWAYDKSNEVAIWNIKMDANAEWVVPKASEGINRTVYYYEGDDLSISGQTIPHYHAAEVASDQELKIKNGQGVSKLLILQGKPIEEPVVQHGPFVMNTKQEIQQAFDDYQRTRFGGWPWPRPDQVHDRLVGRFAIHADKRKDIQGEKF